MARTNNDRLLRRAARVGNKIRARIRQATSANQFGPGRNEVDTLWPSDFWSNHRS